MLNADRHSERRQRCACPDSSWGTYYLCAGTDLNNDNYIDDAHLDDENLDPKTWCRFPILSGGFKRELTELDT